MPQKEKIQQMFDSIAPGYDAFNHLTSLGADRAWRRRALREVIGPRVLDEACGTGDFTIAIANYLGKTGRKTVENVEGPWSLRGTCHKKGQKRGRSPLKMAGPSSKSQENVEGPFRNPGPSTDGISLVGVDISEGMLEVMRRKVEAAGLSGSVGGAAEHRAAATVSAEPGDCCALRYTDASFDTVTVAFGVRNFEDREKALQEVLRVLRPGGRFVMLELGIPRNPVVRAAYKFYFTRIMPLIGRGISKDKAAYRYLPASVLEFPNPEDWTATMQKAGFADVRHRPLSLGICNLFTGVRA